MMPSQQLHALVFDFGGVLLDWTPEAFFRERIADPDARRHFLDQVFSLDWHLQHDAGRPFAETSTELIARHPDFTAPILAWGHEFPSTIRGLIPGMGALIAELAAAQVPLYAISNFSAEFFPGVRARWPEVFAPFHDIILSADVGLLKPDPAIYRLALEHFHLKAGEALFIDDRQENVAAAVEQGFAGHLFHDEPRLRAALKAFGVLPPARS